MREAEKEARQPFAEFVLSMLKREAKPDSEVATQPRQSHGYIKYVKKWNRLGPLP